MSLILDTKTLGLAFDGRSDLQAAIRQAAVGDNYIELFNQISQHVCSIQSTVVAEPASKKRKLEGTTNGASTNGINGQSIKTSLVSNGITAAGGNDTVVLEIKDISLVVPQRKKYTLCFTASHIYARLPDSPEPVQGISYAWKDIEHAFFLPVPEKSQKQYNYILFPRNSGILPSKPPPDTPTPQESLVFTIPDSGPKPGTISGSSSSIASSVSDDYKSLFHWALTTHLEAANNPQKITESDPKLFSSAVRQPHRPSEKAVHVKAFRGSKDGYIFFLPNGILWGFKKPLAFLAKDRIVGVAYLSVLQRTFDMSAEVVISNPSTESKGQQTDEEHEEIEFKMIDQEDYAGIDAYVKRHGLQDKSLAEQRKAKRLGINAVKDGNGEVVGGLEAGELERAQKEVDEDEEKRIQDEEDEEEEDYDPGSEGESEGSGSSSEEEGADGEGVGDEEDEEEEEEEEL